MLGMPDSKTIGQGMNMFSGIMKSGLVQYAAGLAGTPIPGIGSNVKKTRCREAYKDKNLQPSWIREKIPTFGNVGGVLGIVASYFLGKVSSGDPENPNKKLGLLSTVLKWGGLLGIAASIYSQAQGIFVKHWLSKEEQALYVAGGDLPAMFKEADFNEAAKEGYLRDSEHRHPISMSYNPDEVDAVLRPIDQIWKGDEGIRAFYIGGPGTGKTHTMWHTLDQFRQYGTAENKKVTIKVVNGDILATGVAKQGILAQAAELAKGVNQEVGQQLEQVTSLATVDQETRFQMLINSFIDFAKSGSEDEIRVIAIDEIDKLWKLAETDDGKNVDPARMAFMAKRLQELLDCKSVHLLMTGNGTTEEMCGLTRFAKKEDIPQDVQGLHDRLAGIQVHMSEPTLSTISNMIANELAGHEKYLDDDLVEKLNNSDKNVVDKLGLVSVPNFERYIDTKDHKTSINPAVFDLNVDPNELLNAITCTRIHGRLIHRVIDKALLADLYDGKLNDDHNNIITVDLLREYLERDPGFIKIKEGVKKEFADKFDKLNIRVEQVRKQEEQIQDKLNIPEVSAFIKLLIKHRSISGINNPDNLTSADLIKVLSNLRRARVEHDGLRKIYESIINTLAPDNLLKANEDDLSYKIFELNQSLSVELKKSQYSPGKHKQEITDKLKSYVHLSEIKTLLSPGSEERSKLKECLGETRFARWIDLLEGSNLYASINNANKLDRLNGEAESLLEEFKAYKLTEKKKDASSSESVSELQLWLDNIGLDELEQIRKSKVIERSCDNYFEGKNPEANSRVILKALKKLYTDSGKATPWVTAA